MAADVLVTRRLPASAIEKLGEVGTVDMHRAPDGLPPAQLQDRVRGVKALVCSATDVIDEPLLAAADLLRVVATVAVGYDNIDVDAARRRRIIVTHTPDVLTAAVAETTWGLILAITHRIVEGDRLIHRGAWTRWSLDFMLGTELRGKRLGIVGAGRIGRAVAARADAFGMEAVFSARVGERDGAPASRDDLPRVSFDELLVSSDVVSLHLPLTPATHHLINRRTLARMKRSAYLINVARGSVVDEAALAWALDSRLIAGAGLDVYEDEPRVLPALTELDNVVLAPHLGSATRETRAAMTRLAVDNVIAVLSGRPPLTPVPATGS